MFSFVARRRHGIESRSCSRRRFDCGWFPRRWRVMLTPAFVESFVESGVAFSNHAWRRHLGMMSTPQLWRWSVTVDDLIMRDSGWIRDVSKYVRLKVFAQLATMPRFFPQNQKLAAVGAVRWNSGVNHNTLVPSGAGSEEHQPVDYKVPASKRTGDLRFFSHDLRHSFLGWQLQHTSREIVRPPCHTRFERNTCDLQRTVGCMIMSSGLACIRKWCWCFVLVICAPKRSSETGRESYCRSRGACWIWSWIERSPGHLNWRKVEDSFVFMWESCDMMSSTIA